MSETELRIGIFSITLLFASASLIGMQSSCDSDCNHNNSRGFAGSSGYFGPLGQGSCDISALKVNNNKETTSLGVKLSLSPSLGSHSVSNLEKIAAREEYDCLNNKIWRTLIRINNTRDRHNNDIAGVYNSIQLINGTVKKSNDFFKNKISELEHLMGRRQNRFDAKLKKLSSQMEEQSLLIKHLQKQITELQEKNSQSL